MAQYECVFFFFLCQTLESKIQYYPASSPPCPTLYLVAHLVMTVVIIHSSLGGACARLASAPPASSCHAHSPSSLPLPSSHQVEVDSSFYSFAN